MNDEEVFWMLVFAASVASGNASKYATTQADNAVIAFRNSEVLFPHQPPERYPVDESEDAPF